MRRFNPSTYRNDEAGISLLEVVVSMVVLSIVTAFVASFVAGSLRAITRSEATTVAATIAQEQLDKLLAVPIKQWGYDEQGKLRTIKTEHVKGKDGLTYKVTRELSQNPSDLNVQDACPSVVGHRTSRADIVVLKLTVNTDTGPYKDSYSTTTYIARDGNSTFLKSSLTIRFNVSRGKEKTPYQEGRDGSPIHVNIKDRFRNSKGNAENNNLNGTTSTGCITFLELKGKSPEISFDLGEYRLNDGITQQYTAKVNMISGGHRELVFDLFRKSKLRVVPDIVGVPQRSCDNPRLLRMRTVIQSPQNRAFNDLREIARVNDAEARRLEAIPEDRRSQADKTRLLSYANWQYYLVCQGSDNRFRSNDYRYWFLLPESIPISIAQSGDVRPVGRWSKSDFKPLSGTNGLVEEGDWPIIEVDNPKVGGENQSIFAGSCLMNDGDRRAKPYTLPKSTLDSGLSQPQNIHLPMWTLPLEGWYKAKHLDTGYKGYLPLVIKQINDKVPTPNMFGDDRIRSLNENWYAGCKEAPVFNVGWLKSVDLRQDFAQMRLALPYGLYAYSIYGPNETEEVEGQTVTRSRNTCFPQKRGDRYAGERTCIPSGARRVTYFQTDVRAAYRPSWWGAGENIYRDRYTDWVEDSRGPYPLPRGPILDACEANPGDFKYCEHGPGKDAPDNRYHDGPDDDHPKGQVPGFGSGNTGNNPGGGGGGGSVVPPPNTNIHCWQFGPYGWQWVCPGPPNGLIQSQNGDDDSNDPKPGPHESPAPGSRWDHPSCWRLWPNGDRENTCTGYRDRF